MQSLKGMVACVTGASRGIGQAIALALAKEGCRLGICSRKEADIESCKKQLEKLGAEVVAVPVDVSKKEEMVSFCDDVMKKFGRIDIWVNNAGCLTYNIMENAKMDEWDRMVDVNCKGVLHGIGCCLPIMKKQNSGHIVNISSDGGIRQFDYITVYCATKHFVEGLALGLRREVAKYNIRVTNILPGEVGTDIGMESTETEAASKYLGMDVEESDDCESSEEEEDEGNDQMLHVSNIADTVLFISF